MDANVESLSRPVATSNYSASGAIDLPAKFKLANEPSVLEDHVISSYGGVDKKYRSKTVELYNRLRIANGNAFRQ